MICEISGIICAVLKLIGGIGTDAEECLGEIALCGESGESLRMYALCRVEDGAGLLAELFETG